MVKLVDSLATAAMVTPTSGRNRVVAGDDLQRLLVRPGHRRIGIKCHEEGLVGGEVIDAGGYGERVLHGGLCPLATPGT